MTEAARGTDRILDGLNSAQAAAVTHEAGPLLIIAGAGTGKTTVITRRIAHLIATRRARPSEILALTFTDKAAIEMEERVDTLVPYGYADVQISTFHAFGDHLIRENALELGLTPEFRVLTRAEQVIFLRAHLFELPLGHYRPLGDPTRHLQAIISHISRLKDEDVGPEEYLAHAEALLAAAADDETRLEAEEQLDLARTYAQYQALMVRLGQVDFGDQIVEALRLFRSRPHVLRRYQERFKHILVDEFQDTNFAQNQLVQLLAAKHGNLTVVADDDQSIYKWRGAALSNVMAFKEQYAGARDIVLTENYRCPQAVLDSAYRLIQYNNPDRLEVKYGISKRLTRVGADDAADRTPEHLAFDTVSSESDRVAAMIAEDCAQGRAYGDFAILVRANNDADAFLRALNMRGIPWTFSGNAGLYGRPEVRLLIAFLRTVAHPDDSVSLHYLASSDIYQVPIVDLTKCATYADRKHRWLFDVLRAVPDEIGPSEEGAAAVRRVVADLERYMELARESPTGELLYQFLLDSGLMTRYAKAPAELEQEVQNVSKFFNRVKDASRVLRYDNVREFVNHLDALIEAGDDPAVAEAAADTPAVHVLTVHKAKGLEWPVVFLVNCLQNRFPSQRRPEPLEIPAGLIKDTLPSGDFHLQEERRLFYVGMTRAKERLYLTSAENMGTRRDWKVSQFVLEALDLPRTAVRPFRAQPIEELERHAPPPPAGGGEPAPLLPGRRDRGEPQPGGRLPDLSAQVPLRAHPAHPAPAAPRRGLRQRAPRRRRVLPEAPGGGQLHRARGRAARVRRRLAQRGLPDARARGAAQARRCGGPDALLSRGRSGGRAARRRRAGVRLRARGHQGARPLRPRGRHPRGRGHHRLQVERRDGAAASRPARARQPAAPDLRARPARDDGASARRGGAALPRVGARRPPSSDRAGSGERRRRGLRRRRGDPRAPVRGDALVPGLPLLPVQPDLPEHGDPGMRKGNP